MEVFARNVQLKKLTILFTIDVIKLNKKKIKEEITKIVLNTKLKTECI